MKKPTTSLKKYLTSGLAFAWLMALSAEAQALSPAVGAEAIMSGTDLFLIAILALEGLLILLALMLMFTVLKVQGLLIKKNPTEAEQAIASKGIFAVWMEKMADVAPLEKEQDMLLDHDYDGIHELDNNLPPWWKLLFNLSIAFGIGYLVYFHLLGYGKLSVDEYEYEMAQAKIEVEAYMAKMANAIDETNVAMLEDENRLAKGKEIFLQSCAACHGRAGEGGVGPNMADEYWIHGNDIKDIFRVVKNGVPEKGMIAWKAQLSPAQMQEVSSYIVTLQGTNPPNAKAPQGDHYPEGVSTQEDITDSENTGEQKDEISMLK